MEEAGRFSKAGLGEAAFKAEADDDAQLRLLVHCPGCPPFLVVVAGIKTVGDLQAEIVRQHRELFAGGDIPAIKIRWLEDSQHYALAASSTCSAVLADREKIFACSALDPLREGVWEHPGQTGSALELVSHWRNTCLDTAARLSALSQQDGREEEVFEAGGLQVLFSIAIHSGNLMPGDIAMQDIHAGLRSLLRHQDAAHRIMSTACEGQVLALLQCPDPDLAGLAAFMCARLAAESDRSVCEACFCTLPVAVRANIDTTVLMQLRLTGCSGGQSCGAPFLGCTGAPGQGRSAFGQCSSALRWHDDAAPFGRQPRMPRGDAVFPRHQSDSKGVCINRQVRQGVETQGSSRHCCHGRNWSVSFFLPLFPPFYPSSYPFFLPLLPIPLTHKLQTARC